eukprot:g20357.t1
MDCAKGMVYSQISSFDEVSANGHVEVMEAYPWAFQVHVLGRVLETAKKVPCERDAHVVNFWPMQRHAEVQPTPSFPVQRRRPTGAPEGDGTADPARVARVDWRGRFARFRRALPSFRPPFAGPEISSVEQADEIAYCRCRLRADVLSRRLDVGIYLEVEVFTNPDNVSLAVVDFEAGGCSSVTFSPDTGAVIRERKVREAPRKVEGAYIQPLATITAGQGFEGCMGALTQ